MQISLDWLGDFVDVPPVAELCQGLARAGVEVDEIIDPTSRVEGVVVGQVLSCEPHPKADRLSICQVTDGAQRYTVVCGAPNVAAGQRVAFARLGAKLPAFEITRRNIRGTDSEGMLCSLVELGLAEKSEGIWVLPETAPVGEPIFSQVPNPAALVLGVTPNRPDLLSHAGVAREVAASFGRRMKGANWRLTEKGAAAASLARVVVEDPKGCRRYVARVLTNVKVGPSPQWLRDRLERAGQRSINNVVDATNYVLMELGQPLHAFDLARLAAESGLPTIRVRRARAGETLSTLDGVDRQLDAEDLVIADASRPVALAGIMGGSDSEVSEATTSILLESAYFEPLTVRRSAKRHGMHTEASRRFERGADIGVVVKAADRCAQLITEIAGGEVCKGIIEVAQKPEAQREINLRLERVQRVLGISLPAESIVKLLEPLEIRCSARTESALRFQPPTFRPDVTREVDLLEEIARRHGYDEIPDRLPDASGAYRHEPVEPRRSSVARECLLAGGCNEIVTYGFGGPAMYGPHAPLDGEPVRLLNPLGEELSALRTSLLPGLLQVAARNQRHGTKHARLFEIGVTFRPLREERADERDKELVEEQLRVGIVMFGGRAMERWYERGEQVDFSDLAGVLESLVDVFAPAQPLRRLPQVITGFHPHAGAELRVGDTVIGVAGQLHPDYAATAELGAEIFAAEISLDALARVPKREVRYNPIPKFPGTRRDVAVVVEKSIPAETLRTFLAENAGGAMGPGVVEQVRLFDVYAGKPIPDTHVSLAFAIEYRSRERTLTDREVGEAFEGVLERLKSTFAVEIRQ